MSILKTKRILYTHDTAPYITLSWIYILPLTAYCFFENKPEELPIYVEKLR